MCVVDQEVGNHLTLLVHITSLCFPLDTWRERRRMADEGMANCIDIILPPLGVFFKFACGVSCPSIVLPVLAACLNFALGSLLSIIRCRIRHPYALCFDLLGSSSYVVFEWI
uniref:Uncharacterized protein n=1 Tax=Triticum urartu TaxID=4572 RepID=A0A8R7TYK4_TRIUA